MCICVHIDTKACYHKKIDESDLICFKTCSGVLGPGPGVAVGGAASDAATKMAWACVNVIADAASATLD